MYKSAVNGNTSQGDFKLLTADKNIQNQLIKDYPMSTDWLMGKFRREIKDKQPIQNRLS